MSCKENPLICGICGMPTPIVLLLASELKVLQGSWIRAGVCAKEGKSVVAVAYLRWTLRRHICIYAAGARGP